MTGYLCQVISFLFFVILKVETAGRPLIKKCRESLQLSSRRNTPTIGRHDPIIMKTFFIKYL